MIPIQFVFNKHNFEVFGTYEREIDNDIDYISIYLDAIALSFDNTEKNLIREICYVIEHEMWHFLLKNMNIENEHLLIYTIMDYRTQGEIKSNLGKVLDKKRSEITRGLSVAYA
jgi:hypothetical protein